jgi:hypothetical protein
VPPPAIRSAPISGPSCIKHVHAANRIRDGVWLALQVPMGCDDKTLVMRSISERRIIVWELLLKTSDGKKVLASHPLRIHWGPREDRVIEFTGPNSPKLDPKSAWDTRIRGQILNEALDIIGDYTAPQK